MGKRYGLLMVGLFLNCSAAFPQEPAVPAAIEFAQQLVSDWTMADEGMHNENEDFYVYAKLGIFWGKVYMDYGICRLYVYLTDDEGEKLHFDSTLHAVNYLSSRGWELVNVYVTVSGDEGDTDSMTHYLVKKKLSRFTPEERKIYEQYVQK